MWSLFCVIRVYLGLHFLKFILENLPFVFLCFLYSLFGSNVLNQDIKTCDTIKRSSCYVICFHFIKTHRVNTKLFIKILLCKTCPQRGFECFKPLSDILVQTNSFVKKYVELSKRYHKLC